MSLIYKLAGGLGNQLFSVSEGFSLFNLFGQKVFFDISSVEHSANPEVEINQWMQGLGNWFQIGNFEEELESKAGVNLCDSSDEEIKSTNLSSKYFYGWRPNIAIVKRSGLFQSNVLPESFKNLLGPSIHKYSHGLHLRLGDYLNSGALGGNIALDRKYLLKIAEDFKRASKFSELLVVSDDVFNAQLLLSQLNLDMGRITITSRSPISDLCQLSLCAKIYASPSTFSFWSAYFSKAEVFFPKPFYFSNPHWESKLIDSNWHQITRVSFLRRLMLELSFFAKKLFSAVRK